MNKKKYYNYEHNMYNKKEYTEEQMNEAIYILVPIDENDYDYIECIFETDIEKDKVFFERVRTEVLKCGYCLLDGSVIRRGQGFEKWYNG